MVVLMDAILGLIVIEACGLMLYHRLTGHGPAPRAYLANIAAGFFLLLTARLAAGAASSWLLLVCLFAALCAHLTDLVGRWPDPA